MQPLTFTLGLIKKSHMEFWEKIGFTALGFIVAGIGYLIKRKIENKPHQEALDRHKSVLDIHKQMNEQGLSVEELKNLEQILTGKSSSIKYHTDQLTHESEAEPIISESDHEFMSQVELNIRAGEKFERAKEKLQEVIAGIDSRVGDFESQSLMNSQRSWEIYSVEQAKAAASGYRGGSIYSLIYFSELESLTLERTARLQAELDELIRIRG